MIPLPHRSFAARLGVVVSIVIMAGSLTAASFGSRLSPTGMCGSDGTVVIIDAMLSARRSSQRSATRSVTLKAGTAYRVTLYSWEDRHGGETQSNERWHIQLLSNGSTVYTSGDTPDIPDAETVVTWQGTQTFSAPPDTLVATHRSGTPSGENGDSVWAVCAVFKEVGQSNTPPEITINGETSLTVEFGDPYVDQGATAKDKEDGNLTSEIKTSGLPIDTSKPGSYTVTYNVKDKQGATDTKTRTVEVKSRDTTRPVIALKGPNPVTLQLGERYTEPGATATDNVDDTAAITNRIEIKGFVDTTKVGTYTRTYNVKDDAGNPATQRTRTVEVKRRDTTRPVIALKGPNPVTLQLGERYTEPGATATDNVDDTAAITNRIEIKGFVDTTKVGTYTRTYNVKDDAGNPATQRTRTIRVKKDTPPVNQRPVITVLGASSITVSVAAGYVDRGATAFDKEDGRITRKISTVNPVDTSKPGIYIVRYNVEDSKGRPAFEKTRTVEVVDDPDVTRPEIRLIGPERITVKVGSTYRDWGATATDDRDGVITDRIETPTDFIDTSTPGTYTVTYNVEDAAGNEATPITRTVRVIGDPPPIQRPVITIVGNNVVEVDLGDIYVDQGATATDEEDGDITFGIVTVNPVDNATTGTYTVTYNITDSAGRAADQRTRTVQVVEDPDPTPDLKPVISPIGDNVIAVAQHSVYVDAGATAIDKDDGDVTARIITDDPVDTAHPGTYTVTYNVRDLAGQPADQRTRTVHVIEAPEEPQEPSLPKTAAVIVALTDNEGDRPSLSPGDELEYTVWFANLGSKGATVSFELELPRGVLPLDGDECAASPCTADVFVPAGGELESRTVGVAVGDDAPNLLIATVTVQGDGIPDLRDQEPTVLRSDD